MKRFLLVAGLNAVFAGGIPAQDLGPAPSEPDEIIEWLAEKWMESGWGANGAKKYMRPPDDAGWKARMLAMQKLVNAGVEAIPTLTEALKSDNVELQIFAAQTFGYLPDHSPADLLATQLTGNPVPAVRLYSADSLGMKGGKVLHPLFEQQRESEQNRDVKKHLGYAIERGGEAVDPEIVKVLTEWDPGTIDSAEIGKPAPDFELQSLNGDPVRLSNFRGRSAVVLVFIYGDT